MEEPWAMEWKMIFPQCALKAAYAKIHLTEKKQQHIPQGGGHEHLPLHKHNGGSSFWLLNFSERVYRNTASWKPTLSDVTRGTDTSPMSLTTPKAC